MSNIYLVGGAVRDLYLGIKPKDFDFVVETNSFNEMRDIILNLGLKIVVETPQYNTIRAVHKKLKGVDFSLPRRDIECDGRHAKTQVCGTIMEDLNRRDFTMNAMAMQWDLFNDSCAGLILDPFNGRVDIRNKLIRFVGSPMHRIGEDELRILRAMRFAITKGFELEENTANTIRDSFMSDKISNERIFEELNKMFAISNSKTIKILNDFNQLYLLDRIKLTAST